MRFWLCLFAAFAVVSSARAAPRLEAYGRLPAIEQVSLSPSGERFALVGRESGGRMLYVRSADGTAILVAKLGENRVRGMEWAGEDHLLITSSATLKGAITGMFPQQWSSVLHIDLRTRNVTMLLGGSKAFVDAIFGSFGTSQIAGVWYANVAAVSADAMNRPQPDGRVQPSLYRVNLDTGAASLLSAARGGRTRWVVGSDGAVVGRGDYDPAGRKFFLYGGADGERPIFDHQAGPEGDWLGGLGRTPGTLMLAVREGGGQTAREFRPGGPTGGEILFTDVDADEAIYDRASGLFLGMTGPHGERMVDPSLQKRTEAAHKAFPDDHSTLVAYSKGLDRMVMYAEGPRNAGVYWLVDIAKRSAIPIGEARPDIKDTDIGPMRMVAFKASDGLAMDGLLTLPPGRAAKDLPLLVLPHPKPQGPGDHVGFHWLAQAFASRGYAVFQPNYRGTEGYGETFRAAATGQMGRKMQTDLSDGVAELARQGVVDPKRVCLMGTDFYSGYAALAGVTLQRGQYRCAISLGGVADLKGFLADQQAKAGADQRLIKYVAGLAGASKGAELDALSPSAHVKDADAPILLIHGKNDGLALVDQAQSMARSLKGAGKTVDLMVLDKDDGALTQEPTRQAALAQVVAFVEKNNPPN